MVPVIEILNLKVAAGTIRPTQPFTFLTRVIAHIDWASADISFAKFGVDTALTNGIQFTYIDHNMLPQPIKKLDDFTLYAYDTRIDSDTQTTPAHHMSSRLSFFKFTLEGKGLIISPFHRFAVIVQDNLSGSSNTAIELVLQGWRWE